MRSRYGSWLLFVPVALSGLLALASAQSDALHPCGLIYQDPRTIPGFHEVKYVPVEPGHMPADAVLAVDLTSQMPPVGNQGSQGSCTAWAVGYYQKTHYEWIEHGWSLLDPAHRYSPAFIYNQINGGADQGSGFYDAMELVRDQGCCNQVDMPYNQGDYTSWPSESAYTHGIWYRGDVANWFNVTDSVGINMIKQRLNNGYTTVVGINVWSNFDNIGSFHNTYCSADRYGTNRGGHAVTVIGYDDTMTTHDGTGAFKMINSWGAGWGAAGFWWYSYSAILDPNISQRSGSYLTDRNAYAPSLVGRVKLTHPARDRIGIRVGVGRTSSPLWTKDLRTWRWTITERAFPSNNLVFDMTEGESYISGGQTDSVFVRVIDDLSDGKTGTIDYYAGNHLGWGVTGVSTDPVVTIPDAGTAVYARARITRPRDAGVAQIIAPAGTVDSGSSVSPQAKIKNYGTNSISFPVTFRIGAYSNTQNVTNLAPGDSATVTFAAWTATQRGSNATRCSTALTGDNNTSNDTLSGTVWVRVLNAGVTQILAPTGTIDSGTSVTPRARVKNLGTNQATFTVTYYVGSFYWNAQNVTNLNPGDSTTISFANWSAIQRGTHATRCTTALTGDQVPANNLLTGTVTVRVNDAAALRIVAPTGTVDSGSTVTPQAWIKNASTAAASFPVIFRIGSTYADTQTVTNLAAGDSALVNFDVWAASPRGTIATRCTTRLNADANPSNNLQTGSVFVRVTDVGAIRIVSPTGTVDSGSNITPQARVRNFGNAQMSFPVMFRVGSFYSDVQTVTNLNPGESTLVSFTAWPVTQRGTHATKCSTQLATDQRSSNDPVSGTVLVRARDVGVVAIVAPSGTVDSGSSVVPQARVGNYGSASETFSVIFRIGAGYTQTRSKTLGAGLTDTVNFPAWTANARGVVATRCSTYLSGDPNRQNDTLGSTITVRVNDVGVGSLVNPTGTVDSGTNITPQARVRNYGTVQASFPVVFRIGTSYSDTQNVANLNPGESLLVSFSNWTAGPRGALATRCSTRLAGDANSSNNARSGSVTVRVADVCVRQILAPSGTVDSGTVVTPRLRVRNNGTQTASFPVALTIGGLYADTQNVTSLAAGDSIVVSFANWVATPLGTHATQGRTLLAGDVNPVNDTLGGSVLVRTYADVGVRRIVAPVGAVDSGVTTIPQTWVRNFGTGTAGFTVTLLVGSGYTDTRTVAGLARGDSILVGFNPWVASPLGTQQVRCTTAMAGDQNPLNNSLVDSVLVRTLDAGVSAILAPSGTLDSGATVAPRVVMHNYGSTRTTIPVRFTIHASLDRGASGVSDPSDRSGLPGVTDQAFEDSLFVTLGPAESAEVSFAPWRATQPGTYLLESFTTLPGDRNLSNDSSSGTIVVRHVRDVAVTWLNVPNGLYPRGTTITPSAVWHNRGSEPVDFEAWIILAEPSTHRFYQAKIDVAGLGPGLDTTVNAFPACTLLVNGNCLARCSTYTPGDGNRVNDVLDRWFSVQSGWSQRVSMPLPPSGSKVKDGGWIAYNAGNGTVYAAKGNRTADFYAYDRGRNIWLFRNVIPMGREGTNPKKGATGCADGNRYLYATKGNNSAGFWRYDVQSDSWTQLSDVPLGSSGTKVKGGTDMVYVTRNDTGYVYLLKGMKTEFYRYNTISAAWEPLAAAPAGTRASWTAGSFIVANAGPGEQATTIYAHKAKYHELWAYDIASGVWNATRLTGMPFIGRMGMSKKSKGGGSGAWLAGSMFALKGGNTQEFWRYQPLDNAWTEMDTVPLCDSTGRKRKVNSGGDITTADQVMYAIKGNNSCQLWCYVPDFAAVFAPRPGSSTGSMVGESPIADARLSIVPNPVARGLAVLHWNPGTVRQGPQRPIPGSSIPVVRVFDAAGRTVLRPAFDSRTRSSQLDLRGLSTGVYLVKLSTDDVTATQKLVVER